MNLSKHFERKEFACKCGCGYDVPSTELVAKLEYLRELAGNTPLTINSGCRCGEHNEEVGGSKKSQHTLGNAADVKCPKHLSIDEFAALAEKAGFDGIGKYRAFIHVDVRGKKARWDYR